MAFIVLPCSLTVSHSELSEPEASPRIVLRRGKATTTRILKCAANDAINLSRQLLGWNEVSGKNIRIYQPHHYEGPGTSTLKLLNLYAVEVSIAPFGAQKASPSDTTIAEYTHAILTVSYETPEYDQPEGGEITYISESLEPSAEFMTLPTKGLYWGAGGTQPLDDTEAPGKIVRLIDWVYTLHFVPYLPPAVMLLPGTVNMYDVYSRRLNWWFAWGTLLCGNPSLRRETTNLGTTAWTITMRFTYRNAGTFAAPLGWNVFPRPSIIDALGNIYYDTIKNVNGNTVLIYPPADVSSLIL